MSDSAPLSDDVTDFGIGFAVIVCAGIITYSLLYERAILATSLVVVVGVAIAFASCLLVGRLTRHTVNRLRGDDGGA